MIGLEKLRDSRPEAVEQPGAVAGSQRAPALFDLICFFAQMAFDTGPVWSKALFKVCSLIKHLADCQYQMLRHIRAILLRILNLWNLEQLAHREENTKFTKAAEVYLVW